MWNGAAGRSRHAAMLWLVWMRNPVSGQGTAGSDRIAAGASVSMIP